MKLQKRLSLLLNAVCLSLVLCTMAFAYIDPSVTTYAIQAIAGIVIAVGAAAGIFWRRAKKKAQEKLGIDENAKKETEADVVAFDENPEENQGSKTE